MAQKHIRRFLAGFVAAASVCFSLSPAGAQTVYQPVQYQFGRYGEVFYGGVNSTQWGYINGPAGAYTSPAIEPLLNRFNFPSPEFRPLRFDEHFARLPRPVIFTDLAPYIEAGQYGYTVNDARNEAYLNVPRYQVGPQAFEPIPEPPPIRPLAHSPSNDRNPAKAIPLLDWAKAEQARGKNPQLVAALLKEAARYDSAATEKARLI